MPLQKLSQKHERIVDWLILNPEKPLSECAKHFGYTQPWLSTVINSDMFQALLREKSDALGEAVRHSISAKLQAIAYLSLEKTEERLEGKPSDRFLIDSGRMALQSLGYMAPQNSPVQQHLHLHATVNADVLLQARDRIAQAANASAPVQKILDGNGQVNNSGVP